MILSFVVIHDLDVISVAFVKFEADQLAVGHCHSTLCLSMAFELMQSHTFQWTEVGERFGNVQSQQQINGPFEIQSPKLVRAFAVPDLPDRRIPPGLDHGYNILRETVKSKNYSSIAASTNPAGSSQNSRMTL